VTPPKAAKILQGVSVMKKVRQVVEEALTPEAFRRWVHSRVRFVGCAGIGWLTPIAIYIKSLLQIDQYSMEVVVGKDVVFVLGEEIPLPRWARKFREEVDKQWWGEVSKWEVLKILERIT